MLAVVALGMAVVARAAPEQGDIARRKPFQRPGIILLSL